MEFDVRQLANEGLFACQLTLLTPFHGTKLWRDMAPLINEADLSKFDLYHLVWDHPHMSASEARDVLAWAQRHVNDPERIQRRIKNEMKDALRRKMAARGGAQPPGAGSLQQHALGQGDESCGH
jgi:hypothetical protein